MGIKRHQDLLCWQRADSARAVVLQITGTSSFQECLWLRDQMRRSASSACANMAEGFARFHPKDFARFLVIAKASLTELVEHLETAERMGAIDNATAETIRTACHQSIGACIRLIRYLRSVSEDHIGN
jgi:four helix bundle protein